MKILRAGLSREELAELCFLMGPNTEDSSTLQCVRNHRGAQPLRSRCLALSFHQPLFRHATISPSTSGMSSLASAGVPSRHTAATVTLPHTEPHQPLFRKRYDRYHQGVAFAEADSLEILESELAFGERERDALAGLPGEGAQIEDRAPQRRFDAMPRQHGKRSHSSSCGSISTKAH